MNTQDATGQAIAFASDPYRTHLKENDKVICIDGKGTGGCRKGSKYVIAHVTPSGYVRVIGNENYQWAGRFRVATLSA